MARAILRDRAASVIQATGTTVGLPELRAGTKLDIGELGARLSGEYLVTQDRAHLSDDRLHHQLRRPPRGIRRGGRDEPGRTSPVSPSRQWSTPTTRWARAGSSCASPGSTRAASRNWVPVAAPSPATDRGVFFMPEVDDEVVVGFLHGDFEHPVVLGCAVERPGRGALGPIRASA